MSDDDNVSAYRAAHRHNAGNGGAASRRDRIPVISMSLPRARATVRSMTMLTTLTIALALLESGCTTVRVTPTERSSIEQRLLVRSLERAAARLDITPLVGRRLRLELFSLTKDQAFAREFLRARLEERGLHVTNGGDADLSVQVFTAAIAVDTAETFFGIPTMQVPVLAVPIPEIALFKWERSRGHAELQSYVYDAGGRLLGQVRDALGEAKYDRFTILIFISFSVTDLDERPPPTR
jgi:hypothetical protein